MEDLRLPVNGTPRHRSDGPPRNGTIHDFIGIGFGPSNLALAVAARELDASRTGLFFERSPSFRWHPGMMIEGARMQISFLKDLVTLRNPASPFTFLQYTRARGRLERFINLREFHPTRIEYQDYLCWVAEAFREQVQYSSTVTGVTPVTQNGDGSFHLFRVEVADVRTGAPSVHYARNVVYAPGGKPRVPQGMVPQTALVTHSTDFLPRFPDQFSDRSRAYDFAVVGDGQSAGEIVAYILDGYANARVHLFIHGYAPRATDSSPFVNEQFYSTSADSFYGFSPDQRAALLQELRNANYGVVDPDLIASLYRRVYMDEVRGVQRLFIHPFSRFAGVHEDGDRLRATVHGRFGGTEQSVPCDGLVLATGYSRTLDAELFAPTLPFVETDGAGKALLTRHYRVRTTPQMRCGLYVQGYGESSFGLGDTLLSLLPFRSREIFEDICASTPRDRAAACAHATQGEYPPRRHLEDDPEKLYAVIERFSFATVVSARDRDDPVVTHLPLTLDRSRGARGVLFGHLDRANPHLPLLDGRPVLVLFHGPNAFISPHVYESDQLPTWNSVTVHVRGRVRLLDDREALVRGLCGIAAKADPLPGAYALDPSDPRIEQLIRFIVGFEIEIEEIVGRFKLSQDRNDSDRRRAALALARRTETGERLFLERIVGCSLPPDEAAGEPIGVPEALSTGEFDDGW